MLRLKPQNFSVSCAPLICRPIERRVACPVMTVKMIIVIVLESPWMKGCIAMNKLGKN